MTTTPLTMGMFGNRVEMAVDASCDTFGGTPEALAEIAAGIVGIDLPEAPGTITIDGLNYAASRTDRCVISGSAFELAGFGESPDGQFRIEVASASELDFIQVIQPSGRILQRIGAGGEFLDTNDGRVGTTGIVEVEGSDGVVSLVAIDVGCDS